MLSIKSASALCLLLVGAPVLSSFADDETTQTLHSNSFQETANGSCGPGECYVFFPPTQHVNTVVTAISCAYRVPVNVQTLFAQLATEKDNSPRFNLQTFIKATYQNLWWVALNSQVNFFVKQADTPFFYITVTNDATPDDMACTISGYHS
jgi:hypothetical protein